MNIEERAEKAVQLKMQGTHNCAQAVTAALADLTGVSEEVLKNASAGFCAGMGTMEATCGALIGAGIVAGLESKGTGTLMLTRVLMRSFEEKCGAVKCRDLKAPGPDGKPLCPCDQCVRNAVLAYGEISPQAR